MAYKLGDSMIRRYLDTRRMGRWLLAGLVVLVVIAQGLFVMENDAAGLSWRVMLAAALLVVVLFLAAGALWMWQAE